MQLPNGTINPEYYVLEYPNWVNVIAITKGDEFVLIRQYRHALGETRFEIVAGCVDPIDATPMDAAKRELLEETGFGGGEWKQILLTSPNSSAMNNLCYSFLATGVERIDTQHLEATEDITVHLIPREQVLQMLQEGEFMQAMMVAPLYKYFYTQS